MSTLLFVIVMEAISRGSRESENTGLNVKVEKEQGKNVREFDMGGNLKLEVVCNFCYLGDVLKILIILDD